MHNGPHEGGNASYPVGTASTGFLRLYSEMTVPAYPRAQDGITYFIWTDLFFADEGTGIMNQFVPQLLLGEVLSGSTGPPDYNPTFSTISSWMYGAHYFFELLENNQTVAKAAYGPLFPARVGETLFTLFEARPNPATGAPEWTLKMGAVADPTRTSTLFVPKPYMGLGGKDLSWA